MKKIFTLAIGSLLTLATMAADHKPSVTVQSSKNYQIVIDGKSYSGNNYIDVSGLYPGYHSVKVYAVNGRSFFRKRTRLIAASDFRLTNSNIMITIDRFGKIDIDEQRPFFGNDDHGRGWDTKDYNKGNDHDKKDAGRNNHQKDHNGRF